MLTAPAVLGAQAPSLDQILQEALIADRQLQGLALDAEVSTLQSRQADLPSHTPLSIGLGNGLSARPASSGYSIAGSPGATFRFGEDGETTLDLSAPFSLSTEETGTSSVSPELGLSHEFSDLLKTQNADPDQIEEDRAEFSRAQRIRQRQADLVVDLLTAIRTLFSEEQNRISKQQDLADARSERENLVVVQRRNAQSLQVLQVDDSIASAEFDIQTIQRNQEITLATVRRLTGMATLELADLLNIELPEPEHISLDFSLSVDDFSTVQLARMDLLVEQTKTRKASEPNPISLTLGLGGNLGLRSTEGSEPTGSAYGRGQLSEGENWSAGLELGYSSSTVQGSNQTSSTVSGPYLSITGTWSPSPSRADSEQNKIARQISELTTRKAEIALDGAMAAAENSLSDLENEREQLVLSEASWNRRLAIARASVDDAARSLNAGIGSQAAVDKASRSLESQSIQGRIIALNKLIFLQKLGRNTL